jgi:IS1 family transposase
LRNASNAILHGAHTSKFIHALLKSKRAHTKDVVVESAQIRRLIMSANSKVRIEIVLTEKEMARLRILQKKSHASSASAVMRDALDLYETIVQEREAGGKLFSVHTTKSGAREEKQILVL